MVLLVAVYAIVFGCLYFKFIYIPAGTIISEAPGECSVYNPPSKNSVKSFVAAYNNHKYAKLHVTNNCIEGPFAFNNYLTSDNPKISDYVEFNQSAGPGGSTSTTCSVSGDDNISKYITLNCGTNVFKIYKNTVYN